MENKVIIFDMDGVIFDSIPLAEKFYLGNHPGMTSEEYRELHAGNFHEESKKYSHIKKEESPEEKARRQELYAEKKKYTLIFPGMLDLLKKLHESNYVLILNTNAFDRNCLPLLKESGIDKFFDFVATAELSKSKVEKFQLIEDKYKTERGNMLFVTDSLGDVKEAEQFGIPTIAVTWGVHDHSYFKREKYSCLIEVCDSVTKLSNFIEKN